MKLLAFIFEQPSYIRIYNEGYSEGSDHEGLIFYYLLLTQMMDHFSCPPLNVAFFNYKKSFKFLITLRNYMMTSL